VWMDREGKAVAVVKGSGEWGPPRISPDGNRAVAARLAGDGKNAALWMVDARGSATPFTDSATNTASCSSTITVVDTTPPVISNVSASPDVLWPPNHKMVDVTVHATATDTCGPATWKIISVSSNEVGKGKGSKSSSAWKITGDHTVNLRAERDGKGSGRVYTITVQAKDVSGNLSTPATVTVTVPHDQGKGKD